LAAPCKLFGECYCLTLLFRVELEHEFNLHALDANLELDVVVEDHLLLLVHTHFVGTFDYVFVPRELLVQVSIFGAGGDLVELQQTGGLGVSTVGF